MKILLDTHIWLWIQDDPGKTRAGLWQTLVNPENELWLSPVSTWEALVLESKGRIQLPGKIADWAARNTAPFRVGKPRSGRPVSLRRGKGIRPDPGNCRYQATRPRRHRYAGQPLKALLPRPTLPHLIL